MAKKQVEGIPEIKTLSVIVDNGRVAVQMKGVWTRALVDSVHVVVLKKLVAHQAELRQELSENSKEKEGDK